MSRGQPPIARVDSKFFALAGGLDMASPATMVSPGRCFDSNNYEIDSINGGYRLCYGYERIDGHTSPTASGYWMLPVTISGTISVGSTVTGVTSGGSGKVLLVGADFLVLGRVTPEFVSGEAVQVSAVTQATSTAASTQYGASTPELDSGYRALAADDRRTTISAVPGSGAVRGVALYKDVLYAWRDNVGATACVMHKETAAGWVAVTLFKEIAFTTGMIKPAEGATLYGGTSTATGTVKRVATRTGSWGSSAAGYIVIDVTAGTFQSGEALKLTNGAGATQCTSASLATAIAFQPGGRVETTQYNFTGSTDTLRMYGCDTKSPAFEFDGTVLAFIRTGMTTDTPSHIATVANYLYLSFYGSVQSSGVGDHYSWAVITGANEIALGDTITAMLPQPGDASGATLSVFGKGMTKTLYISSTPKMVTASPTSGAEAYTAQWIVSAISMSQHGIQRIDQTQAFGDFQFATVSGLIQTLINQKIGTSVASAAYKERNQYRVFFSDGTALAVTFKGSQVAGIMPITYTDAPTCYTVGNKADGREYCYFGDADGYVYQDNIGTSHDGAAYARWLRLPFNHVGAPQYKKRFRKAVFDLVADNYSTFQVSYEMDGGGGFTESSAVTSMLGTGAFWDQFTWELFTWDAPIVDQPSISLDGTAKNMSLLIYSESASDASHVIQGVSINYTVRRLDR